MISFVTAYYNRRALFIRTLESLVWFGGPEFEFVVVDDGSRNEEGVEDLVERFPFLRVFRLDPAKKWYTNPCIPFNYAIRQAKGDTIILQNPECFHAGPVLRHAAEHLRSGVYLAYSCYALSEADTQSLQGDAAQVQAQAASFVLHDRQPVEMAGEGWFNHSRFWPNAYHFCAAITRRDLEMLGGFDERYAAGFAYDDVELVHRIRVSGMEVRHVDEPFVFHQNHYVNKRADVPWDKFKRNGTIHRLISEPSKCVNINGAHWGDPYSTIPQAANAALDEILDATAKLQEQLAVEARLKERVACLEALFTDTSESASVLRETVKNAVAQAQHLNRSPITRWAWRSRDKRELAKIEKRMTKAISREHRHRRNRNDAEAAEMFLTVLRATSALVSRVSSRVWWWKHPVQAQAQHLEAQTRVIESWQRSEMEKRGVAGG